MRRRLKPALIVLMLLIVATAILSAAIHRAACAYYGYQTDRDTRYAAFVGCMVAVNGRWVPREELRVTQ